jgi:hypothetical protein
LRSQIQMIALEMRAYGYRPPAEFETSLAQLKLS